MQSTLVYRTYLVLVKKVGFKEAVRRTKLACFAVGEYQLPNHATAIKDGDRLHGWTDLVLLILSV